MHNIWIADDDEAIRLVLEESLSNAGFKTKSFSSADDLLKNLDKEQPDLIITDVQMPGMLGYDLLKHINNNYEDMPVIALAPESEIAEKLVSNLEEVKARGGTLFVFSDPSISMDLKSGRLINMPKCDFLLTPIIYTIPLQILSYEVALLRGTDIDQPRNLAKTVTVE